MLNPAVSLIVALLYSLLLSFSRFEIFYLIPIVPLLYLNYKNIVAIFKKLILLNLFIVVLALFIYFEQNLYEASDLFLRVNCIILFNLLLFFSSQGFDIIKGFMILKFPKKFVSTLYFTVRYILDLNSEYEKIKSSLKARNFRPKTDLFTYETYGNIFGILFIKAILKAQKQKEIFLIRGFRGEIFLNYQNSLGRSDCIFLIFFALFIVGVLL